MQSQVSAYVYPIAHQEEWSEDFHGRLVPDPYHWLEDPDSPETQAWVAAQNELSAAFLAESKARPAIRDRLTVLWDYPKTTAPFKRGGRYFLSKNDGLQNQFVLLVQDTLDGEPRPVLDPNLLSDDGTVAVTNRVVSHDGTLLAYGTSASGSDWQEIRIREVDSGRDYDEVIRWCKFSGIAWKHDQSGFFYNRFPDPDSVAPEDRSNFNRVYWHRLGTPQAEDALIYERPDAKELAFTPVMSDDGAFLLLSVWHGTDTRNRVYYRPADGEGDFVRLLDDHDARYQFVDNVGSLFYFHTDLDAPRGRVIAIDVERPGREHWREIIPEGDDAIDFVITAHDQLAVVTLHHAHHQLKLYDLDGRFQRQVELPTLGTIMEISGKRTETELFLDFTSFLFPSSVLRYDCEKGTLETLFSPQIDFDFDAYQTRQVFYHSGDGTRVPMFLVHHKDLALDGSNPTLLFGYGGFNISLTPAFTVGNLVWLESGGVYAVANIRGGGEYGREWHQAGTLDRKQNVFDDFIAAGEWLIENGITDRGRLAIAGGSNGGLLVAACMTQRPDLFGAVICRVPVIDMLHYHRWTIGRYWVTDYGNAEADPAHFAFLFAYSPYHNVVDGQTYPPTLIMTADTDDRVVPAHAKKFGARLQAADAGHNPIIVRVETKAGHGLGKPTAKVIEEQADMYAFLHRVFGMT